MHRFFADETGIANGTARLNAEDSRHALRVLRLDVGDEVELVCEPAHYLAGIAAIEDGVVTVAIRGELRPTEAKTRSTGTIWRWSGCITSNCAKQLHDRIRARAV